MKKYILVPKNMSKSKMSEIRYVADGLINSENTREKIGNELYRILRVDRDRAYYDALAEPFMQLIQSEVVKTEKAFGGCKKCYGKGYATYRSGTKISADFIGDKDYTTPMVTQMLYCLCDRGKLLAKLKAQRKEVK